MLLNEKNPTALVTLQGSRIVEAVAAVDIRDRIAPAVPLQEAWLSARFSLHASRARLLANLAFGEAQR